MLSARLIQMIEDHAEELMGGLIGKLKTHPRTSAYTRFSDSEIHDRLYTVYKDLGAWMLGKPEEEIRRHYEALGLRRYQEGIPLFEVLYAGTLSKSHLLDYIRNNGLAGTVLEIYAEQELTHKINQFFDNAIYFTAKGYQQAAAGSAGQASGPR